MESVQLRVPHLSVFERFYKTNDDTLEEANSDSHFMKDALGFA